MRGITRPAPLSTLAQRVKTDELKLKNTIEELVKTNQLKGKISKGLFVPTSFQKLQKQTVLDQLKQNGYVEESLFSQLQINVDAPKFFKQELADEVAEPVKFSGFMLSKTQFTSIEDQITQMCADGTFLNLNEILPDCFKKPEQTTELLGMVEKDYRPMADDCHIVSVALLNKCLARFEKRSEAEAITMTKKGTRPEKLLNQQEQQDQ